MRVADPAGIRTLALIDAVAVWCEALHGHRPLGCALASLSDGVGALGVALSRHTRGRDGGSARVLTQTRTEASSRLDAAGLDRSYARSVLGAFTDRPRIASVWYASHEEACDDPSLGDFQMRARVDETVVIPIDADERHSDFLELHRPSRATAREQAQFNLLADTLSRTWRRRRPGLFAEAILARQPAQRTGAGGVDVLASANPARLSRSEYRVCLMLRRGLSSEALQEELGISRSTLRSHLRSIFAKTDTGSQAELLYLLLAPPTAEPPLALEMRRA